MPRHLPCACRSDSSFSKSRQLPSKYFKLMSGSTTPSSFFVPLTVYFDKFVSSIQPRSHKIWNIPLVGLPSLAGSLVLFRGWFAFTNLFDMTASSHFSSLSAASIQNGPSLVVEKTIVWMSPSFNFWFYGPRYPSTCLINEGQSLLCFPPYPLDMFPIQTILSLPVITTGVVKKMSTSG